MCLWCTFDVGSSSQVFLHRETHSLGRSPPCRPANSGALEAPLPRGHFQALLSAKSAVELSVTRERQQEIKDLLIVHLRKRHPHTVEGAQRTVGLEGGCVTFSAQQREVFKTGCGR